MKKLKLWLIIIFSLFFIAELLILLRLPINIILTIILLHILFFIIGIFLSAGHNWIELSYLDSNQLNNEPLTLEFIQINLGHLAIILIMIPSIFSHIIGIILLIPSAKNWISEQLWPEII